MNTRDRYQLYTNSQQAFEFVFFHGKLPIFGPGFCRNKVLQCVDLFVADKLLMFV